MLRGSKHRLSARQTHPVSVVVEVEQVVVSDGDVEQTPRRDARRVIIVILRVRRGDLQKIGTEQAIPGMGSAVQPSASHALNRKRGQLRILDRR